MSGIRHDGEYPHDQSWVCDEGHHHCVWNRVVEIPDDAIWGILGIDRMLTHTREDGSTWVEELYLINKGYVVFHYDYSGGSTVFAVYTHDSSSYIIKSSVKSVVKQFNKRQVGEPIEGLTGKNNNFAMGMAYIAMPDDIIIEDDNKLCPNKK